MSKTLRTAASIAGAVALVATGVGAIGGVAIASSIASYASVAATALSVGAQLTAKKPAARGSVTDTVIQVDPAQPYMLGRTYSAGVIRHDVGYGGEVDDVKNPYLGKVVVYSGGGPIQEIESRQFDYQPLSFESGWYFGYVGAPGQLGTTPEAAALVPPLGAMPDWGSAYKLSGQAAVLWNFKFDKKGKRFASGIPPYGIVAKGVRVYDPRFDSTYPGGSGPCRLTDETTWGFSENPALHALVYAYGRYQNGKKVLGVGLPATGIDMPRFVTLANICDANGWKVGGTIFEPGDRWANLKDILAAGGAEPVFVGGVLSVRYRAPMVALDTVTKHDLAEDDLQVTAMQSYRDRINGVVPKYRSEAHNWQYVSTETVSVPEYVAEDGEEKTQERQYNLVQQANQAAQLAAYELVDGREMGPISLTLKPQWRRYKPGECLHLTLPDIEVDHDAIILSREFDPATLTVKLTLITETPGKHAFALGQTATPPPTPSLTNPQDRDEAVSAATAYYTWIAYADSIDGMVNFTTGDRGTRNFVGIAANRPDPVESENPADYQWSASMGAPEGTEVAGKPAEDLVEQVDQFAIEIAQLEADTAQALLDIAAAEATIASMQGEVADLGDRILAAEGDIDTLETVQATQGASITTLQTTASTLEGEVASIQTDLSTAEANISTNASAISGLSSSVSSLSSTVSTQGASITTMQSAITTLQGDLATLSTTVGTQGASITTLQSSLTTLDGNVATLTTEVRSAGVNLLKNSSFGDGTANWTIQAGASVSNANLNGLYAVYLNNSAAAGTQFLLQQTLGGAVAPGDVLTFSADFNWNRSAGTGGFMFLRINWLGAGTTSNLVENSPKGFGRRSVLTATAPTGTTGAIMQVCYNTEGTSTISVRVRQLKCEAGSIATSYSQEATIKESFTAINGLFARWAVELDVNGYISGIEQNNNGTRSDFRVRTDKFEIVPPSGTGNRTQFSGGVWRVYSGSIMTVWGVAFGSSNQFIRWTGPQFTSLSSCTEANAIEYVKTNGDAYFGGALSTGTFKNSVTGTLLTATATTILGPFSTNGNNKVVNVSVVLSESTAIAFGSTVNPTTNPSVRATLYRSRDGTNWTQLRQDTYTGSWDVSPTPTPGEPGRFNASVSGSYTYTDSGGTGTSPMYYRVITDNRTWPGINGTGSAPSSQRTTIVSTE